MTATANFRQVAQYIGLAIFGLMMRTAFGVFGILWGIIGEIVNGVFPVAIGGKAVSMEKKTPMFSRFTTFRIYFAQNGLDLHSIRFELTDEKR